MVVSNSNAYHKNTLKTQELKSFGSSHPKWKFANHQTITQQIENKMSILKKTLARKFVFTVIVISFITYCTYTSKTFISVYQLH